MGMVCSLQHQQGQVEEAWTWKVTERNGQIQASVKEKGAELHDVCGGRREGDVGDRLIIQPGVHMDSSQGVLLSAFPHMVLCLFTQTHSDHHFWSIQTAKLIFMGE